MMNSFLSPMKSIHQRDSPEETLPGGEVGSFEQGVFQDALHAPQGLNHVRPVVVEVPQLPVVSLVSPPKWVLLQDLRKQQGLYSIRTVKPNK